MPEAGVPGLIGAGLIGVAIGLVLGALMVVLTYRRTGASQKTTVPFVLRLPYGLNSKSCRLAAMLPSSLGR